MEVFVFILSDPLVNLILFLSGHLRLFFMYNHFFSFVKNKASLHDPSSYQALNVIVYK